MRTFVVVFAIALAVVFSSTTLMPSRAATSEPINATPALETSTATEPNIVVLQDGQPIDPKGGVSWSFDHLNRSLAVAIAGSAPSPVSILIGRAWLLGSIPHPSFGNASFTLTSYADLSWYNLTVSNSGSPLTLEVRDFQPEQARVWYTVGSADNIALERPMQVQIVEVPHAETRSVNRTNANGTWSELRKVSLNRLGISFKDANTSGQTVTLNKTWLAGYGLTDVSFSYADGTAIADESDAFNFYLHPAHFSILYAFTSGDGFGLESPQPYSDVHWDTGSREIYILSDRQDPVNTNERLANGVIGTYDDTTSFTTRATWQTWQQGNWQGAAPVFLMGATNAYVETANSIYVHYYSRDSNRQYSPYYYLSFRDNAGTLHQSAAVVATANMQYELELSYNGYTRSMYQAIYNSDGTVLGSWTYNLPSTVHFSVGKVGAAAWGAGNTQEPTVIAKTDTIYFDGNIALDGNFEQCTQAGQIPTGWQQWVWASGAGYCSQDGAKYGVWSVKIVDTSTTASDGLQTARIAVGAGTSYVGSSWVYAVSGGFAACIEAWDSQTYGTRLGATCTGTATTGTWEYLETYMAGPSSGTNYIDLLLYSSLGNTGTAYFDGAELHLRRSFWAFNVHNGEAATGGTWSGWQTAIDRAAEMGASYIRSDFPWSTFEPNTDGGWDETYVNHWRDVLNLAKTRGIGFIMNVKGPTPAWASGLPDVSGKFGEFCQGIGQRFAGMIPYFQILNEANVNPGDVSPVHAQWTAVNNCYSGLLTGMGIDATAHKSSFHTIFNVFVTVNWETWMRGLLDYMSGSIDIVGIDFYPMTDNFNNGCDDWGVLNGLFSIMNDYGKAGAITETGFANRAYFPPYPLPGNWRDDNVQVQWIDCALPTVQAYVVGRNTQSQSRPVVLAVWYELYDHSTGSLNPLDTYGLIHSDLTEKPGCADVRNRIPSWPW